MVLIARADPFPHSARSATAGRILAAARPGKAAIAFASRSVAGMVRRRVVVATVGDRSMPS
jgi:hypothetical protein